MFKILILLVASLVYHAAAKQPNTPDAPRVPLRPLKFGDLNFLHTTDTHGWHAGHLLEPSYTADWGDYIDFTKHLRDQLEAEGRDLLVVDTGDRVEGNGLYDADKPKGKHTFPIFERQHMDIITVGNHELYKGETIINEYTHVVPAYNESYIASNVDVYNQSSKEWVPLAPRYKKFTTHIQGIRIMSFGFLFDFKDNNKTFSRVTRVEDAIKQSWFNKAINGSDIDLFVVIGHAAVGSTEFLLVHDAIRAANPAVPIQFFGGHVHMRQYKKFDDMSYGLASGRYMETIGFQSIDGISTPYKVQQEGGPTFFRSYIDNNLYSYYNHSGHGAKTFHTRYGLETSKMITKARKELNLDETFGCAPQDYWMYRVPFPSGNSIYTWLNETVIPAKVFNPTRKDKPRLVLMNTGAVRFDIFKGPFTKDTTFIISPFTSGFNYTKDVPYETAINVLRMISHYGIGSDATENDVQLDQLSLAPPEQYGYLESLKHGPANLAPICKQYSSERKTEQASHLIMPHDQSQQILTDDADGAVPLVPGYTTCDDAGCDGDDTIHCAIPQNSIPENMQSMINIDPQSPPKVVDLVFNEFITKDIVKALNLTWSDVDRYMGQTSMTDVISQWVGENWPCPRQ